jgi:hypothetical protein
MSALTGNQIKNTYQGLLKLEDSSTGITQNLQAVEDGLGNNVGLRLAQGQLESDNIPSFIPLKAQYYGSGYVLTSPAQFGAGTQNVILASPFYDNGNYSYSAISIYTSTATSTSDTVELALYTSQMINPNGLFPHTPILSGITADTTTQGQKTFVFPSNISFSGYGAGFYWLVFKISNSGVQPTWRPGQGFTSGTQQSSLILGNAQLFNNSFSFLPIRANNTASSFQVFSGTTTFNNPFSSSLNTTQSSTTSFTGNNPGFVLHTVDA